MISVARYIKYGIAFILLWLFIWVYSDFGCVSTQGREMEPALTSEQMITIAPNKRMPNELDPTDMVYFDYIHPAERQNAFVGRIIAKPGDKVKIENGVVYVNGKQFSEAFVAQEFKSYDYLEEMVVPRDSYFILCDGRRRATKYDTRGIGPVGLWAINGKVK